MVAAPLLIAAGPIENGAPPLTAQTKRSGGPIDPDQANVRFDFADLRFEVLPETQRLEGVATLRFTALRRMARLPIDLDRNLPVSAIALNGRALKASAWRNPDGRLLITLPRPIAAGRTVVVTIRYGGAPHIAVRAPWDDGVVWAKTKDGKTWFGTTAEGYGCDLFWPCLDFPTGEPAAVDLHITVPRGLKAPSNGRLLRVDTLPDGRTTWHWRARQPNTYGIALNVGPYEEVRETYHSRFGNRIPMHYWYLPGEEPQARALFAEFASTLDFFESVIGPYPFGDEKLGVVETPYKGMEHQTINAYGNDYAKAPEGFDWLFHHEFAHEYFGNQLTAANWDDYWLHEGYASYMQPLYGRWREGEARYATMLDDQRNKIVNAQPIVSGRVRTEEEVYETKLGGPGTDIYYKGSWILHTLRGLIGDAAFFEVTRRAVFGQTDPKPGSFRPRFGTTTEYEALVRSVTGRDYGWFFETYLRQAALPELIATRRKGVIALQWSAPDGRVFPMPIELQIDGRIEKLAMTGGRGTLTVADGAHIVLDPHARVLKRSTAVEAYQADQARRRAAAKPEGMSQ
ncbi:M1 family metallopeptidase [Sphingomonas qilianensis]|uniref:M1 family metallopeptidase n=1 Tax=Sphingomonas qilianensis TaxID=1736690 RepID=UPI00361BEFD6